MTNVLFVLLYCLAGQAADAPRDLATAVLAADRVAQANDHDPSVWKDAGHVGLKGLPEWYARLRGGAKKSYDDLRSVVRHSHCFDRPIILQLSVSAARKESDGSLILDGYAVARSDSVEDWYTKDQKQQLADMQAAIHDKQQRHNHDMVRLADGSPYKAERIQLYYDAISEMGEHVQSLHQEFRPAAEKRKAIGDQVFVRVHIAAEDASGFDLAKLDDLLKTELAVKVTEFYLRPPIEAFDHPVAVGMLTAKAIQVGDVTYKPPVSMVKPVAPDKPGDGGK